MSLNHTLFIDGNSIAHANHNGAKLTVGTLQVQAIFGFLKTLRALLREKPGLPIVLWDGRAQWRMDIYADYKGNRKPKDAKQLASKEAFKAQMPILEKALEYAGVTQIRSPLLEADDYAGFMVPVAAKKGRVTMVTGDQDWLQLVEENAEWYDPIRDRTVTLETFYDSTGYKDTRAFVQGKALQGDSSDNVPPCVFRGIGEKSAPLFLAKYGSVEAFFEAIDKQHTMKLPTPTELKLAEPQGRANFERNMKLMDLSKSRRPLPGETLITSKPANRALFEALCKRLMFASILREMDKWEAELLRPISDRLAA